jgi:hypothetical protein
MTVSPEIVGRKIWQLLAIEKGDEIIFSRDRIGGGILVETKRRST